MPPVPPPSPPIRVVFFGTPEIALPTLERLIAGPHEVVAVVSQPDRPRGRGRKLTPSPVSEAALRAGISLLRPERVGDAEIVAELEALTPDLGVVVAFGQFIPKKIREMPRCGFLINAHASLLPKYRGAAPIARAIAEGERETGISVMRVEKEMDAGPVALVEKTPIGERENTAELSARLADIAADAISKAVDLIARDEIIWTDQDASQASIAQKLRKSDATLALREDARSLACRIHALSPRPGGLLTLLGGDEPDDAEGAPLRISRADTAPFEAGAVPEAGTIERNAGEVGDVALRIATGDGWLIPLVLQRPGGKALPVADFLRGFEIASDARCALVDADSDARAGGDPVRSETAPS